MASDQLQTPERELDALRLGDTKQLRCEEQHQVARRVGQPRRASVVEWEAAERVEVAAVVANRVRGMPQRDENAPLGWAGLPGALNPSAALHRVQVRFTNQVGEGTHQACANSDSWSSSRWTCPLPLRGRIRSRDPRTSQRSPGRGWRAVATGRSKARNGLTDRGGGQAAIPPRPCRAASPCPRRAPRRGQASR